MLDKLRAGFHIYIREGSGAKNLETLIRTLLDANVALDQCAFCTDDKHIEEIRKQKEAEEQAKREAEEAERKAAEAKKAQEAAAEVEQTEPQSEIGKVIGSIERSAFSQAIAREAQAAPTEQAVDPFAPKEEPKQEKKYRVRFFADGTKEQLGQLIAFMNENNIKYGKIAKESK